jgi:glycine/D-amino acid oxidase-like deaminating enzyme
VEHTGELEVEIEAPTEREVFEDGFEAMRELLQSVGVRTHLSTPVAPLSCPDGRLAFRARGRQLDVERVIWCANPTALIIASGLGRLDSPVTNMFFFVAELSPPGTPDTMYHQVFSDSSCVVRVFTYDLEGSKITVEGFDRGQSRRPRSEPRIRCCLVNPRRNQQVLTTTWHWRLN